MPGVMLAVLLAASAPVTGRFNADVAAIDTNGDQLLQSDELENWLFADPARVPSAITRAIGSASGLALAVSDPEAFHAFFFGNALAPAFAKADADDSGALSADELEAFEGYDTGFFGLVFSFVLPAQPPAPAVPAFPSWAAKEETSFLDALDSWLGVRKSFLDEKEIGKPATLGYSNYSAADETLKAGKSRDRFEIRGAVILEPERYKRSIADLLDLQPQLVTEVDYSSDQTDSRNKLTHRLGGSLSLWHQNPYLSGQTVTLTGDLVATTDYRQQTLGATAQWTPNSNLLAIGAKLRGDHTSFCWRPYLALIYAHVLSAGGDATLAAKRDVLNLQFRLAAEIKVKILKFTGELEYNLVTLDGPQNRLLLSAGVRVSLDEKDRVSIQFNKSWGRRSPDFKMEDQASVSLGIKL